MQIVIDIKKEGLPSVFLNTYPTENNANTLSDLIAISLENMPKHTFLEVTF